MEMDKLIKVVLAVLFFLCLVDMPYGFYQLVRFLALVGFGYLAFQAYENKRKNEMFIYVALALLFQPLIKITLGREIWSVVDVVVGVGLLVSVFKQSKS
jgi:hypothetical protein